MYTGRISEIGTVIQASPDLVIHAPKTTAGLSAGGSVNVSGTCLSAVAVDEAAGSFSAHVCTETATRSTLAELQADAQVNLELPLRLGDPMDGHLVQGHTDAIGKIARVDQERAGSRRVWIRPPKRFLDEIIAKGSVAVEGISLTVAEVLADRFAVALIPATLRETTLSSLKPDQRVNLESDLFVKSLEAEGVEYVFGIPGEENLDLLESLRRSKIRLILTRHEQAAGFMAATYGRLTGRIVE